MNSHYEADRFRSTTSTILNHAAGSISLAELPQVLQAKIFSYDNTYRDAFNTCLEQVGFDQKVRQRCEELRASQERICAFF